MTQENTKTEDQKPKTGNRIIWICFAILIVAVYFIGLTIPLVGPDEPRYAEVAREMFVRGDWVTPTLGGFDWFEKPALLYWLEIASYKLFGVNEFAARFGSALFGLGTIFALWILGKFSAAENTEEMRNFENNSTISKNSVNSAAKNSFANWLALIAASSIGLIVFSRGASFDIILTFPITASLVCYFLFENYLQKHYFSEDPKLAIKKTANGAKIVSTNRKIYQAYLFLAGFYFFIGFALIAKGLVGIVFPFGIVFFYHILGFELLPSRHFLISLTWGTILSLLVASIWYVPMYQTNGWKFIEQFFIEHHFQRYTSNKYQHPQPFYFFFWVLPLMTIPWLPFFFAAIWKKLNVLSSKFKVQSSENKLATQNSSLATFAWAWLLVPLVFFSISGSKLPGYILPALPAALILTAQFVYEFVRKSRTRKIILQSVAVSMLLIIAVLAQFVVGNFLHEETVKHLVDTANTNGYKTEKILNLHTISHSAEFYGADRLIRETDGKQKRFYGVSEVLQEMKNENAEQILVLIPLEYLNTLTSSSLVESQVLDNNGELAVVLVKQKNSALSRTSQTIRQS